MKKIHFIIISLLTIAISCSCKKEFITQSPSKIESTYFQKWIGGQELTGGGTNLYIQLANKLPENVYLAKVYFQGKEADFEKKDETNFVAYFYWKPNNADIIMDNDSIKEYGNKVPEITEPKFKLKPTEAVLEFHNNNKVEHYKIVDIKEKELLAYPSARPRN